MIGMTGSGKLPASGTGSAIPLAVPNLSGREAAYLQECIDSSFVSSVGPFVPRFEHMVAAAAGFAHCAATSSGTTALHAALMAVGVERDDLVILPSFTFIASANAIAHCCASPWLFDVSESSWTLDAELLRKTLASETRRTGGRLVHQRSGRRVAAVMPVYTLGMPADMDPIVEIAREYALPVVCDGAAALGSEYKGRSLGELGADLTGISFNGNKTVTTGGGGAVVGQDEKLIKLVRHICSTARVGEDYHHDRVGYNYRLTNVEAAVGCAQMERLDEFVAKKRAIQAGYDDGLGDLPGVSLFPRPAWAHRSCWMAGISVSSSVISASLRAALKADGIDARPFWKPVHLQPPYAGAPVTEQKVSMAIWDRIVTLPCSTSLTDSELRRVIDVVRGTFA